MKLSFNKDNLMNGINIVLKAVSSKTTMPILECILIDATSNEIKLTGNDMELGIETKVEGMILERGKIALDAKLLSDIIRKLSGDESLITIESDEKFNTKVCIQNTGQGRRRIFLYPAYRERQLYLSFPIYIKRSHPPDALLHIAE